MTARPSSLQLRAPAGGDEFSSSATAAPGRSQTLGESLREVRLRHRRDRLQLVVHLLDEHRATLASCERPIPHALSAAIQGFQGELASLRTELHAIRQPRGRTPRDDKRRAP